MRDLTKFVLVPDCPGDSNHPTGTPIYQTVTFGQEHAEGGSVYNYSRSGNPTRDVLEQHIAQVIGAKKAICYTSGVSAIMAVLELLSPGDEILTGNMIYGGTYRIFTNVLPQRGMSFRQVDLTESHALSQAITDKTKLIWLETPSNPLLEIADIKAIAKIAQTHNILLVADNSLLAHLQRPLDFGVDVVMYSATKHFCGHSDVTAGIIAINDENLAKKFLYNRNVSGTSLAPFESWLLIRGMKTMGLRMHYQQTSAIRIVEFLKNHLLIEKVYYPRPGEVGYEIASQQSSGQGCVLSFMVKTPEQAKTIVNSVKLFHIAASFGCVHSFISIPRYLSHSSMPDHLAPSTRLIRISVGIEDPADLIADLSHALDLANRD